MEISRLFHRCTAMCESEAVQLNYKAQNDSSLCQ